MDRNEALELMKTSNTIDNWNNNREIVKLKFQGNVQAMLQEIDSSGLIVKILGADGAAKPFNKYLNEDDETT